MLRSSASTLVMLCAGLLGASCSSPESEPGFDLDLEIPVDFKGDAPCDAYPGGSLSGDDLLVLVNKEDTQQLSQQWAPRDLMAIPDSLMMPGRKGELRKGVLLAFREMVDAAREEEALELIARSAYRSFAVQCWTFDFKVQQHGLEHAKRFSAEPGRSQHQLATTIDITSERLGYRLQQSMGDSAEGVWLEHNAHRFGFALSYPHGSESVTGYAYEPWHYRYIGREAAFELLEHEEILETYLRRCQDGDFDLLCPSEELPEPVIGEGFIGGPCETAADCIGLGPSTLCLGPEDGYPEGLCTRSCQTTCPDRAGSPTTACLDTPELGGLCHSRCDFGLFPGSGCRSGLSCEDVARPQGDSASACVSLGGRD